MLVLSRKSGERIRIGETVVITLLDVSKNLVRVGIEAPDDVAIFRQEVWEKRQDFVLPPEEADAILLDVHQEKQPSIQRG